MKRAVIGLLILGLTAGVALRAVMVVADRPLTVDEALSYTAATGHQQELMQTRFQGGGPAGRWVRAAEWKRFLRPEEHFCFSRIASGLSEHDIHPPMYFWLLHVWTLAFGTGVAQGLLLNLAIDALAACLLYRLAGRVLGDSASAVLAVLFWAVSPAALWTFNQIRPYSLLALWAAAFGLIVLRVADPSGEPRARHHLLLALAAGAGWLVHALAWLLIALAGLWLVLAPRARGWGRRIWGLASVAGGVLVALIACPGMVSLVRHLATTEPSHEQKGFLAHAAKVLAALGSYTIDPRAARILTKLAGPWLLLALGIVAAAGLALAARELQRRRLAVASWTRQLGFGERFALCAFLSIAITLCGLYLARRMPFHAMDAQYLGVCWPYLSVVLVVLLRPLGRKRRRIALALMAALAASSATGAVVRRAFPEARHRIPAEVLAAPRLLHNTASPWFLRVAQLLPDETMVLAASATALVDGPEDRLDDLGGDALYLSVSLGKDGDSDCLRLLRLLQRRHRVEEVAAVPLWWSLYRITSLAPPAAP